MKTKLKEFIKKDLEMLEVGRELGLRETLIVQQNIQRLFELNTEFENLLNSDEALYDIFKKHNSSRKNVLKKFLHDMDPYKFETLIANLFKELGYNIEQTKKSNDLGIDIVATGMVGITPVKEVIQVKRKKDNIHRPILDQLRGVMPLHNATSGTIVTLSNFSENCYKFLPPNINLINGGSLIDLLFKHQIGFKSLSIEVFKIDYDYFDGL